MSKPLHPVAVRKLEPQYLWLQLIMYYHGAEISKTMVAWNLTYMYICVAAPSLEMVGDRVTWNCRRTARASVENEDRNASV